MGWTPDQFWRSTPTEFRLAFEGRNRHRRDERQWEAFLFSVLARVMGGDITPGDLLGEPRPDDPIPEEIFDDGQTTDIRDVLKRRKEAKKAAASDG